MSRPDRFKRAARALGSLAGRDRRALGYRPGLLPGKNRDEESGELISGGTTTQRTVEHSDGTVDELTVQP